MWRRKLLVVLAICGLTLAGSETFLQVSTFSSLDLDVIECLLQNHTMNKFLQICVDFVIIRSLIGTPLATMFSDRATDLPSHSPLT